MAKNIPLFTVFGVSLHPQHGWKPRFANDIGRVKVLETNDHKQIELIQLPEGTAALSKVDGVNWLLGNSDWLKKLTPEGKACLEAFRDEQKRKAEPKEKKPRGKKTDAPAAAAGAEGKTEPAAAEKTAEKAAGKGAKKAA